MGRLFQYNRFGAMESANKRKKDTPQQKTQEKAKMLRNAINCADYADIYSEYSSKNLDLAFSKCQPWHKKVKLQATAATATATANATSEPAQSRTHKVYDSMKNFLQRKLFAQPSQKGERLQCEDEPTSDYDEQDLLDSSYQADVEEDEDELTADCSCSSNTSASATPTKRAQHNKSPQKSLLSLNCWQSSQPSDSSSSEEPQADQDDSDAGISDCCQLLNESSSSGKQRGTPKKRATPRYNVHTDDDDEEEDEDEEPELLHCAWYQPRITAKAAQQHLQHATPGSFLLRRSTPRTFELCLRLDHKVKCYAVQCSRNEMYSLKGAKKQFSTLKALITHHSVMAEQLPLTLDMPRERDLVKSSAVRYADDFEPLESLQLLGILKSLQAKNYEA